MGLINELKNHLIRPFLPNSNRRTATPIKESLRQVRQLWNASSNLQEKLQIIDLLVFSFKAGKRQAASPKNLMKYAEELALHLPDNMLAREINGVALARKAEALRNELSNPSLPINEAEALPIPATMLNVITLEIGKAYHFGGRTYSLVERNGGLVLKSLNKGGGELAIPDLTEEFNQSAATDATVKLPANRADLQNSRELGRWSSYLPGDGPTSLFRLRVIVDKESGQERVEVAKLTEPFPITGKTPGLVSALMPQKDGSLGLGVQYETRSDISEKEMERIDAVARLRAEIGPLTAESRTATMAGVGEYLRDEARIGRLQPEPVGLPIEAPIPEANRETAVQSIISLLDSRRDIEFMSLEAFLNGQNWVPSYVTREAGNREMPHKRMIAEYVLNNIVMIRRALAQLSDDDIYVRMLDKGDDSLVQRMLEIRSAAVQETIAQADVEVIRRAGII